MRTIPEIPMNHLDNVIDTFLTLRDFNDYSIYSCRYQFITNKRKYYNL